MIKACDDCMDMIINEYPEELHLYEISDTECWVCRNHSCPVPYDNPYVIAVLCNTPSFDIEFMEETIIERIKLLNKWSMHVIVDVLSIAHQDTITEEGMAKASQETLEYTLLEQVFGEWSPQRASQIIKDANEIFIFHGDEKKELETSMIDHMVRMCHVYNKPFYVKKEV